MKKGMVTLGTLVFTLAFSASVFAAEALSNDQQSNTNIIAAVQNSKLTTGTGNKAFKSKFSDLYSQLETLRNESKAVRTDIKAEAQENKSQWKSLKEAAAGDKAARKALKEKRVKVEPLQAQVKTLRSDVKALNSQKASQWTELKNAVKAKDETKASAALTSIIDLKKQIIEKEKSILGLKKQILELIKT